ncbi:MAG: BlaI/MecI/CopY family transcriptional regulator [Actinomycetota bacterium]
MRGLGELESGIMQILWRGGQPATVREVHGELGSKRDLAYTTVMTVMDRLWRKGLLRREPRGRAFQYIAAISEAEFTAGLMHSLLGSSRNRKEVLAHFLKGMKKADGAQLLRLAEEAARRRRRR